MRALAQGFREASGSGASRKKNQEIEMDKRFSATEQPFQNEYLESGAFLKQGHRERRRDEMKRRFLGLQSRRKHLEHELDVVNKCLISLNQQMENYASYEQLSINEHSF